MRLHRLDGLRGVAALVVVIHHCLLTSAALARPYFDAPAQGPWATALVRTPLHLMWDGSAAVTVFFVLSGFVLTRATQSRRVRWLMFDAQRLVRLYLPTWIATILAVAFALAVPRRHYSGASAWMLVHEVSIRGSLKGCLTLWHPDGLISPLWSLKWEVLFSLLLPLYLGISRLVSRAWPAVPFACAVIAYVGDRTGHESLVYLPIFLCGVVMAHRLDDVRRVASRVGQVGLVVAGLALIHLPWAFDPGRIHHVGVITLPTLGAPLLLAACLVPGSTTAFLDARWAQWLGRISFSLYLTHEPLAVSLSVLGLPPVAVVVAGVPLSLALAAAFYRWVEHPTHLIARRIPAFAPRGRHGGATAA